MVQVINAQNTLTLGSLIRNYASYNAWANRTLTEWLKSKPSELMNTVVPSSFPSVKETLIHIWDVQRFWFAVIQRLPPPPSFRFTKFEGTVEDVYEELVKNSEALSAYIDALSEDELTEKVYLKTPWFEADRSRYEYIHHIMTHSTYHRGQVITIGRNVGLTDAPMTDFNYFLLVP